ncbi:hypothetical protein D3C86_2125030 [compost metagenome]
MLDLGARQHLLQRGGEVFEDQDGFRAGVVQLVFQLARRIQRVYVNHDHARPQDPKKCHRILEQVWHHQCDAIPFLQP